VCVRETETRVDTEREREKERMRESTKEVEREKGRERERERRRDRDKEGEQAIGRSMCVFSCAFAKATLQLVVYVETHMLIDLHVYTVNTYVCRYTYSFKHGSAHNFSYIDIRTY